MYILDSLATGPLRALALLGLGASILHGARSRSSDEVLPATYSAISSEPAPAPAPEAADEPAPPAKPARVALAPNSARSDIDFMFTADGARWVALDDATAADVMAHHPRLAKDDSVMAVVAKIAADAAPVARAWRGREIVVNGTCTAALEHFAYIGRLIGDVTYAEPHAAMWTPQRVADNSNIVLAARVDHCPTGDYAQPTDVTPSPPFAPLKDPQAAAALAAKARVALDGSDAAAASTRAYAHAEPSPWTGETDQLRFTAIVGRDPARGTTWVTAQLATATVCSGTPVNIWGLFRVAADGSLEAVMIRSLDDADGVDTLVGLVDFDHDGIPEVTVHTGLTDGWAVLDANGEPTARLDLPFLGCPC